jgi:hypothetical protein
MSYKSYGKDWGGGYESGADSRRNYRKIMSKYIVPTITLVVLEFTLYLIAVVSQTWFIPIRAGHEKTTP